MSVIECIPNVSEGRRPDVIEACAEAIRQTHARLLDVKPDESHNRTVFTFAGTPDVVRAGALALFDVALARIDLRQHSGEHPRIGAVDVTPFVPIEGVPQGGGNSFVVPTAVTHRHHPPREQS